MYWVYLSISFHEDLELGVRMFVLICCATVGFWLEFVFSWSVCIKMWKWKICRFFSKIKKSNTKQSMLTVNLSPIIVSGHNTTFYISNYSSACFESSFLKCHGSKYKWLASKSQEAKKHNFVYLVKFNLFF